MSYTVLECHNTSCGLWRWRRIIEHGKVQTNSCVTRLVTKVKSLSTSQRQRGKLSLLQEIRSCVLTLEPGRLIGRHSDQENGFLFSFRNISQTRLEFSFSLSLSHVSLCCVLFTYSGLGTLSGYSKSQPRRLVGPGPKWTTISGPYMKVAESILFLHPSRFCRVHQEQQTGTTLYVCNLSENPGKVKH